MALKPDTAYVFVGVHGHLAIPLEHVHILKDCDLVTYDYNGGNREWKISDGRMQMEALDAKYVNAIIIADKMKGTTS